MNDHTTFAIRAFEHGLALRACEAAGGVAAGVMDWDRRPDGSTVVTVRLSDGERFGWVLVEFTGASAVPREGVIECAIEDAAKSFSGEDPLEVLDSARVVAWERLAGHRTSQ